MAAFVMPVIGLCLSGCLDSQTAREAASTRTSATNPMRLSLGLRTIGPHWTCFRSINGLDEWLIASGNPSADKVVQFDGEGKLLWEEDSYLSGRVVTIDFQSVQEQLVIRYDYVKKKLDVGYIGTNSANEAAIEAASKLDLPAALRVADGVLSGWGISRL